MKKLFKLIKRRRWLSLAVLIVALLIGLGIRSNSIKKNQSKYPPELKLKYSAASTYTVKKDNLKDEITLAGKIQAENVAILQFQTGGKLSWVGFKKGDSVRRGQAVASLDKTELKKQFQKEANDYLTSRSTFEDTQDNYKLTREKSLLTDAIRRILDRQQYSLNNAVLDYELSDLAVKYSTIYSPIDGILVDADVLIPGINIIPVSATFTIIDPKSVYFKANFDEEDIGKINPGQKASITIDTYSDEEIDSQVTFISFSPVLGETSTVYEVRFAIPYNNENVKYRLGMNGDVTLVLKEIDNILTIPSESYITEKNQPYVYLKNANNTFSKKEISLGLETDTSVEVTSGLNEGDLILLTIPST